ncbi:MAG: phage portal protein [Verrucomicrobiota bacterium]
MSDALKTEQAQFDRSRERSISGTQMEGVQGGYLLMSGYEAASSSPARGYVYMPSTDSRRQMTPISAREIRKRVHWLYANFGFARRLVNGMSKLIGSMTPQPNTSDDEWNELAFDNFMARAGAEQIFDRAGKFDFFTAQQQINRNRFKDGDSLAVLTETSSKGARLAFYEADQITNPSKPPSNMTMGVRLDKFGRHMGYSLRSSEDPSNFSPVDVRDAIYFGNFETHGQVRGLSILVHAVTNMMDVVQTRGFVKHGIKDDNRIGVVKEKALPTAVVSSASGLAGPLIKAKVTMPDGSTQEVDWEMATGGGKTPDLAPGETLKVITSNRPSQNHMDFEKSLLRDCTWGVDLPYEALCEISGVTGPGIRYVMDEINRWILNEQYKLAKWCKRYYAYHMAKEIKAGRLPDPGEEYWRLVEWIGQPNLTIDKGREGKLSIINLETGNATWAELSGNKGIFWKKQVNQRINEVGYAKKRCAEYEPPLDYREVFPGLSTPMLAENSGLDKKEK